MKRERLKKLRLDVSRHFPPPRPPGFVRVIQIPSLHVLDAAEIDKRSAAIPRKPGEHRIFINVIQVKSRVRQPAASVPAADRELTTAELEREVARLEAKKARLLEERKAGLAETDKKREARVRRVKRVLADAEERRRR